MLLLKLKNGEFNGLDTEDPHTLQLFGFDGIYANCVAHERFVHGHYRQGGRIQTSSKEIEVSKQIG